MVVFVIKILMSTISQKQLQIKSINYLVSEMADMLESQPVSLESRPSSAPPQCGTINDDGPNDGLTERSLQDAQRLYLMNDVVQPESVDPLVMQDDVRFSNLVVDIVQGMDTLYHVIYISTGGPSRELVNLVALFQLYFYCNNNLSLHMIERRLVLLE